MLIVQINGFYAQLLKTALSLLSDKLSVATDSSHIWGVTKLGGDEDFVPFAGLLEPENIER